MWFSLTALWSQWFLYLSYRYSQHPAGKYMREMQMRSTFTARNAEGYLTQYTHGFMLVFMCLEQKRLVHRSREVVLPLYIKYK